jgi:hypothetical protein
MGIMIWGRDAISLRREEGGMDTQLLHIDKNISILSQDCCVRVRHHRRN